MLQRWGVIGSTAPEAFLLRTFNNVEHETGESANPVLKVFAVTRLGTKPDYQHERHAFYRCGARDHSAVS